MWKSLGYAGGPLVGGVLVTVGGFAMLFATLGGLAFAVAVWAAVAVPAAAPLPRARHTVADLARRLGSRGFLVPTVCLAATTAALSVGVGFLPVRGAAAGLNSLETGAAVSLLAIAAALVQPFAGRARDAAHLTDRTGMTGGLLLTALGLALAALLPGLAGLLASGLVIGVGIGVATPLGFAALAASTAPERLGQTMGAAEVGRELGDAGGPLLVASLATAATLTDGLLGLAVLLTGRGRRDQPYPAVATRPRRTARRVAASGSSPEALRAAPSPRLVAADTSHTAIIERNPDMTEPARPTRRDLYPPALLMVVGAVVVVVGFLLSLRAPLGLHTRYTRAGCVPC